MDLVILLVAAFSFAFIARLVGLPPLVGYIVAGFVLHGFGVGLTDGVEAVAEIGILLLLFGIGLKLDLRTLARPVVGIATAAQLGLMLAVGLGLAALGTLGLPLLSGLDLTGALIVGFALSFSSTVFAVQALERNNETASLGGRLAVSVLILQDLLAVGFLAVAAGTWPSPWLIAVVAVLVVLRPVLRRLLDHTGHGEVFILLGLALAVGVGVGAFGLVGAKPDLGALLAGLLLSGHPRSAEMADRLLSFKDLFLVGFFLSIGLEATPTGAGWAAGLAVLAIIPLRSALTLWTVTRARLRSRTALQTSLALSTYSEFGLIVTTAAAAAGLLSDDWIATVGVAVAASFIISSPLNAARHEVYARWGRWLGRLERTPLADDDGVIDVGNAEALIFGMGRVGTGAYDALVEGEFGTVVGVDRSPERVDDHVDAGRSVIRGDALDRDFWDRVRFHPDVRLVVTAMSNHSANLECAARVREFLPWVRIASIATYPDQVEALREAGVHVARNLYEEAGQGLAEDAMEELAGPERP